jgi:hypothetical protein
MVKYIIIILLSILILLVYLHSNDVYNYDENKSNDTTYHIKMKY